MNKNLDLNRKFVPINIAVITVSDSRSLATDKSGDVLVNCLTEAGHELVKRTLIRDNQDEISSLLHEWTIEDKIDVILTTGGTGLTGRDVTVEAHRDVYEKEIEAFSVIFANVSVRKIGTSAVQSRACAGIANGKYLFAFPGSPSACLDAWTEILSHQFDYRHRPCNFVEIMPRLKEQDRELRQAEVKIKSLKK